MPNLLGIRRATRILQDYRATKSILNLIADCQNLNLPSDPKVAAAAIGSFITDPKGSLGLDYDNVTDIVNNCIIASDVFVMTGNNDNFNNSDTTVQLHFAMQTFRFQLQGDYFNDLEMARESDGWLVVKLGLRIFSDLKRIGFDASQQDDSEEIAQAAIALDGEFAKLYSAFLANSGNISLSGSNTVVPDGMGAIQPVLDALDALDQSLSVAENSMTDRMVQPAQETPDWMQATMRWPCSKPQTRTCFTSPGG